MLLYFIIVVRAILTELNMTNIRVYKKTNEMIRETPVNKDI